MARGGAGPPSGASGPHRMQPVAGIGHDGALLQQQRRRGLRRILRGDVGRLLRGRAGLVLLWLQLFNSRPRGLERPVRPIIGKERPR